MILTIIGAGPGGYVAALRAAQLGAKVNVIESDEVGGTCLNWGCIPTKAIIASVEAFKTIRHLEDYGIDLSGSVTPNLTKIMQRKEKIVSTQVKGIRALFKKWGINLIEGRASFLSPSMIEVKKKDNSFEFIRTDKCIIATGSIPTSLPLIPYDSEKIISSNEAINLKTIPKSLIIVGAGVIGCEFASIFNELGTEVTIIEIMSRALPMEDYEISEIFQKELKKRKIKLLLNTRIEGVEVEEGVVRVLLSGGGELQAEKLLVAIGRKFNTDNIGLEIAGIKLGTKGEILVNSRMETNVPNIYAVGDVVGGPLLAHKASEEGIIAAYNACEIQREMDYSVIPSVIFTSPEIASVGLREQEAKERGYNVKVGRFQYRTLGKAHTIGQISGMFKVIADGDSNRVLGVHIIGAHASDLIHEGALAIKSGLTAKDLGEMVHAHPTLSEGLREAAMAVMGMAIHA
ncbi:MAG: dihydrolipoyl dehydrogenase [Thermodesulfovibrionales bacterium]|nr:dihydrolipoyl dehydrogenase [Thermodesulfovibrionales bacterium]